MPASIFTDNLREQPLSSPSPSAPSSPSPKPKKPKSSLSPKNLAFLNLLISDFPEFSFKKGRKFLFRAPKSISYLDQNENFPLLLLHELSHALLKHASYSTSVERLTLERDAWVKTRSLCKKYSIPFSDELAESELDTYRDWLHQKTLCKTCGLTCLEVNSESLYCPFCQKYYKKS